MFRFADFVVPGRGGCFVVQTGVAGVVMQRRVLVSSNSVGASAAEADRGGGEQPSNYRKRHPPPPWGRNGVGATTFSVGRDGDFGSAQIQRNVCFPPAKANPSSNSIAQVAILRSETLRRALSSARRKCHRISNFSGCPAQRGLECR